MNNSRNQRESMRVMVREGVPQAESPPPARASHEDIFHRAYEIFVRETRQQGQAQEQASGEDHNI